MALSTLTLTDFLLARIAEDEAVARAMRDDTEAWGNPYDSGASIDYGNRFDPDRVLAECEAKRRIVEPWRLRGEGYDPDHDEDNWRYGMHAAAHEVVLRILAAVYADHPDYREEWKP